MMATSAGETDTSSGEGAEEENININGTNDMICAKCFRKGEENGAVGICKICKYYLCRQCVDEHRKTEATNEHKIAFFYCATKLAVNKLVRANSFCLDCGHYLCDKCKLDHRGFRIYRNHTFIGGKTIPGMDFNHDDNCRRVLRSRSTSRALSRQSKRSETKGGRKSPYLEKGNFIEAKRKTVNVEDQFRKQRTLIHSSTGRSPLRSSKPLKPIGKTTINTAGQKSVHYESDQIADKAKLLGEFELRTSGDVKPCHVIASIFLGNDKLVVADQANKNIKIYDSQFRFKGKINIEKFPVAMCDSKLNSSEMYASSGNLIYSICDSKEVFSIDKTIETGVRRIEGLASWESGIAVLFRDLKSRYDKKGHLEVHLLNFDGVELYQITVSSQFAVKLVTPIWYITTNNDGTELLLSDTQNNRIICVDIINWHVMYVLKGKDIGGAPRSLAMDPDGNLLVSWYDEVHKISKNGRDLGIPVSQIDKQSVISYNKRTNCLAVHASSKSDVDKFRVYQM